MIRDWSQLPSEFLYIQQIAEEIDRANPEPLYRYERMLESLTPSQIRSLADVYQQIASRGDAPRLSSWLQEQSRSGQGRVSTSVYRPMSDVFFLFRKLAERGLPPFDTRAVTYCPPAPRMDWSKLPEHLRYLAQPAEKFGEYAFDEQRDRFVREASEADRAELAAVSARIRRQQHVKGLYDWLESRSLVEHPEAANLAWMLELMKAAGVPIEDDPEASQ